MNKRSFILVSIVASVLILSSANRSHASQKFTDCGQPVGGIRLCLYSAGPGDLEVALQNVSERDVILNFGIMLGNGRVQLPNYISLNFTDAHGKTRVFKFNDKRYPGVAGRIDDYVVPLSAGSTYALHLTLDQFWCQETNEFSIPLLPGKNLLTAEFEGNGAKASNLDTPGIKLMNFWRGTVESNTLTLEH